jgi:hypothetical protein
MSRRTLICLAAGLTVLWAGAALAEFSLAEKKIIKKQDESYKSESDSLNKACASTIKAAIDWESFKSELTASADGKLRKSFYGYCAAPLSALRSLCGDADAKQTVQKKVKQVTCKFGGKDKRKIDLKGGTVTYWVDWDSGNDADFCKAFLGKKL